MKKFLLTVAILPLVAVTTVACGGSGGGTIVSPPPPPPPPPDTTAPTASFSPTTLTVASGGTGTSTLTSADNVGVTTSTTTCTIGGVFNGSTFTAPTVTADTSSVCTATVGDAAGNTATATLTVTVTAPPPDTAAPIVSFNPSTVTVASGGTVASTLTASDNVAVTTGPTVTCTSGSFNVTTNVFTAPTTATDVTSTCTATAGDAAGNSGSGMLTANVTGVVPGTKVTISGATTFDFVPFQADNTGLDYNNIQQRPIRGHVVEALNSAGGIIVSGVTDSTGNYSLEVDPNTQVRIRVKAQLLKSTGNTWDARAIDNTSGGALYAIQGSLANSGTVNSTRPTLNAASGWGGSGYTSTRAAAPFAILSPIYDTLQVFEGSSTDRSFPRANFNWSTLNKSVQPVGGDRTTGNIGTSSYIGNGNIYILGNADSDTDEYDDHVIVHEWGHYFEDQLSRSDSIGGAHGGSDRLDIRVAMGEGWGNALSGIGTGDPVYKDSLGNAQGSGFAFSVEGNSYTNEGWFNEGSVQSLIYDIFDTADDGSDTVSLGIDPIFATFASTAYIQEPAFTSIFAFLNQVRANAPGNDAALTALLAEQSINGVGSQGTGETNSGSITSSLPVYKTLTVGGPAVNVCSVNDAGGYNKLGNRAYLTLTPAVSGNHIITATRTSGTSTDPDFQVYNAGSLVASALSVPGNTEVLTVNLTGGTAYAIDFFDDANTVAAGPGKDACFDMTVTN